MAYLKGSYQAGLLAKGYRDNGDGSFTAPDGSTIRPLMSDAQTASINNLAGQALSKVQQGYGADDPRFDPRYGMLSAEHAIDPTGFSQYFGMPKGTELDASGNIVSKPPSWWSTYGPWLLLGGATAGIAAPAIAGAFAGAAGGAAAAPAAGSGIAGAIGAGVPAGAMGSVVPLVGPAAAAGSTAGGAGILGSVGSYFAKNPMVAATAINSGTNLLGGVLQSRGATKAAQIQANAELQAAKIQQEAAEKALAFEQQQAALAAAQQAIAQQANYGQYAAQQRRIGTLGELLGLGPREIPAYVPMPTGIQPNGTYTYGPTVGGALKPQVLKTGG